MHEAGYKLGNVDATIILQRPKLSPHKEAIRANLCRLLDADPSVVNVKVGARPLTRPCLGTPCPLPAPALCSFTCMRARQALAAPALDPATKPKARVRVRQAKTHEKVDSLGENRSIAVHAVIMLIREDLY